MQKRAPDFIRRALCGLSVHEDLQVYDAGNVVVEDEKLEGAQILLAEKTGKLLDSGLFPVLMGGGHEISYGHVKGALKALPSTEKLGVINFDPHFDLRPYEQGAHSGSWARQLFDEHESLSYFPAGINEATNISSMFEWMKDRGQTYVTMDELLEEPPEELLARIDWFVNQVDHVCITLDLDVFSSGIAPGVSAVNPYGAMPQHIKPLIRSVVKSGKVRSFDVAELNPAHDNGSTAKLAAFFIHDLVRMMKK